MGTEFRDPLGQHHASEAEPSAHPPRTDLAFAFALNGQVSADDLRRASVRLKVQARIAEQTGCPELAESFRRAAELTVIPDAHILEIYRCLRPGAASYEELIDIADELENRFGATRNAALVRGAAEAHRRGEGFSDQLTRS